jgi:uncharacterized protein (TIGR01777 family)
MRIVMAGASGFLGTTLAERLRADGHQVVRLVRRPARGPEELTWEPAAGQVDRDTLATADAVVNLAGATVFHWWTDRYKNVLLSSRVDSTGTLAAAMAALPADARPKVLLNASAVGWYGDTGDDPVEEDAPAGDGFLCDLCRVWEAATRPAEDAGVRVVRMRTGYPLHRSGGFLKPQALAFRFGLGGKLGAGRHWLPWISLADWLSAVTFVLDRADVAGPVNMVGPAPVRNAEFTAALGAAVHRPAILPIPAFGLRLALGEFASDVLRSSRVLPGVLTRAGFAYRHPTLPEALHAALTEEPTAPAH